MQLIHFELLTIFFWALTYVLIVISGYLSKNIRQVAMPYFAGVLNFAWEICALIETHGRWVFILWLTIDILIVYYGYIFLDTKKQKTLYIFKIILFAIVIYLCFQHVHGYMYTVFIIDLVMAVCYCFQHKRLSPKLKISIAITKLLGDLFAGFVFGSKFISIALLSALVLVFNVIYLIFCIKDSHYLLNRKHHVS